MSAAMSTTAGPRYLVRGPVRAQDGAAVWLLLRASDDARRTLALAEYMSEHAATRAAAERNASEGATS